MESWANFAAAFEQTAMRIPLSFFVPVPNMPMSVYVANCAKDLARFLMGQSDPLMPPTRLMFDGPPDVSTFREDGEEFLRLFTKLGGLEPSDRVLDVGSGIGRKSIPLTRYLGPDGRYDGFDIVDAGVEWCRKNITARHGNFRFHVADIFNKLYSPQGSATAASFRFPFPDGEFDFVIATSVFTHMLPDDLTNYFAEIGRVLRKGGTAFLTFLLYNEAVLQLLSSDKPAFRFRNIQENYRTAYAELEECIVSYDERFIFAAHERARLRIQEPVRYGSWCGRRDYVSYQDIVISTRV